MTSRCRAARAASRRASASCTATSRTAHSGPLFFNAWTKDGKVIEFGAGPSTAADPNTQAVIRVSAPGTLTYGSGWAVSRISDTFGNAIDFKYLQRDVVGGSQGIVTTGHEVNLAEIQYAGNKVVLYYSDRAATPGSRYESYSKLGKNLSIRQLDAITTFVNSPNTTTLGPAAGAVAAKTTRLAYDTGPTTGRLRLTSIKTCAGDRNSVKCVPATVLGYTAGGNDAYQQ